MSFTLPSSPLYAHRHLSFFQAVMAGDFILSVAYTLAARKCNADVIIALAQVDFSLPYPIVPLPFLPPLLSLVPPPLRRYTPTFVFVWQRQRSFSLVSFRFSFFFLSCSHAPHLLFLDTSPHLPSFGFPVILAWFTLLPTPIFTLPSLSRSLCCHFSLSSIPLKVFIYLYFMSVLWYY